MHDLPTTASEAARKDREIDKFFDFGRVGGAGPGPDLEERDQQDVETYASHRYQRGYDEDLIALRVNSAARIPHHDPRTDMAALPHSTAPPTTGQHLFAPATSDATPTSSATQNQGAPPSMAPHQGILTTAPTRQLSHAMSARPPGLIWPANIDIRLVEICTFCPNWFLLPEPAARAIRNGWTREALGKAQLHALGALGWDAWVTATSKIQKQISAGCKLIDGISSEDRVRHNSPDFRERHGPQDDLTATAWHFKAEYEPGTPVQTGHMPLSFLYGNVINWPVGNDRLLMTQCLEFARNNEHLTLDTSHWDWIIRSQGLTAPPAPAGLNRDVDAYQRLNESAADPEDPRVYLDEGGKVQGGR